MMEEAFAAARSSSSSSSSSSKPAGGSAPAGGMQDVLKSLQQVSLSQLAAVSCMCVRACVRACYSAVWKMHWDSKRRPTSQLQRQYVRLRARICGCSQTVAVLPAGFFCYGRAAACD
jgi:hypothetical protein